MQRISTGINGLDELIEGGFIKNRTILVQGSAGSGKSTFGIQYLINGALNGENGVLFSFDYDAVDIVNDMKSFNWPIQQLIDENKLIIAPIPGGNENPEKLGVDDLINYIFNKVVKIDAKRIVIDSINSIEMLFDMKDNFRRQLNRFITLLRDLECTIILINEQYSDHYTEIYNYMAHGVINLYNLRVGYTRLRGLEIIKMRGTNHSNLTHSMQIQPDTGIVVLPNEIDMGINSDTTF